MLEEQYEICFPSIIPGKNNRFYDPYLSLNDSYQKGKLDKWIENENIYTFHSLICNQAYDKLQEDLISQVDTSFIFNFSFENDRFNVTVGNLEKQKDKYYYLINTYEGVRKVGPTQKVEVTYGNGAPLNGFDERLLQSKPWYPYLEGLRKKYDKDLKVSSVIQISADVQAVLFQPNDRYWLKAFIVEKDRVVNAIALTKETFEHLQVVGNSIIYPTVAFTPDKVSGKFKNVYSLVVQVPSRNAYEKYMLLTTLNTNWNHDLIYKKVGNQHRYFTGHGDQYSLVSFENEKIDIVRKKFPSGINKSNVSKYYWASNDILYAVSVENSSGILWQIQNPFSDSPKFLRLNTQNLSNIYSFRESSDGKSHLFMGTDVSSNSIIFKVNQKNLSLEKVFDLDFDSQTITERFFVISSDGFKIPILVKRKKNSKLGSLPIILSSYSGFGLWTVAPTGSSSLTENEFITVVAAVRGAYEINIEDEAAGKFLGKSLAYQDMIDVAKYLIAKGWAPNKKVLLEGGSNGGLLVLRTALKAPELFAAVYAQAPVTDMLSFIELDTAGESWATREYGDYRTDSKIENFWQENGPYQTALAGARDLPPILITTAKGDMNVNPVHSYKMIKALREHSTGGPFMLISEKKDRGHNPVNVQEGIVRDSYMIQFFRNFGVSK